MRRMNGRPSGRPFSSLNARASAPVPPWLMRLRRLLPVSLRPETMVETVSQKAASHSAWEAEMAQNGTRATGPRCIALVGPFQSGKTTLLEAILARTGAIQRQGTIEAGNTVGDASKEARDHKMSVELSVASTTFMGDAYTMA